MGKPRVKKEKTEMEKLWDSLRDKEFGDDVSGALEALFSIEPFCKEKIQKEVMGFRQLKVNLGSGFQNEITNIIQVFLSGRRTAFLFYKLSVKFGVAKDIISKYLSLPESYVISQYAVSTDEERHSVVEKLLPYNFFLYYKVPFDTDMVAKALSVILPEFESCEFDCVYNPFEGYLRGCCEPMPPVGCEQIVHKTAPLCSANLSKLGDAKQLRELSDNAFTALLRARDNWIKRRGCDGDEEIFRPLYDDISKKYAKLERKINSELKRRPSIPESFDESDYEISEELAKYIKAYGDSFFWEPKTTEEAKKKDHPIDYSRLSDFPGLFLCKM